MKQDKSIINPELFDLIKKKQNIKIEKKIIDFNSRKWRWKMLKQYLKSFFQSPFSRKQKYTNY